MTMKCGTDEVLIPEHCRKRIRRRVRRHKSDEKAQLIEYLKDSDATVEQYGPKDGPLLQLSVAIMRTPGFVADAVEGMMTTKIADVHKRYDHVTARLDDGPGNISRTSVYVKRAVFKILLYRL